MSDSLPVHNQSSEEPESNKFSVHRIYESNIINGKEKITKTKLLKEQKFPMKLTDGTIITVESKSKSNDISKTNSNAKDSTEYFTSNFKNIIKIKKVNILPDTEGEWVKKETKIYSESDDPVNILDIAINMNGNMSFHIDSKNINYARDNATKNIRYFNSNTNIDGIPVIIKDYEITPTGEFDEFNRLEYKIKFKQFQTE